MWSVAGHYMYMNSDYGQIGDQVTLFSPFVNLTEPKQMQFYYNMFNNDTNSALKVYKLSIVSAYEQQLFIATGNHGNSWQLATVCLPVGYYNLAFVATVGQTYLSDLAIDDISFTTNPCSPLNFSSTTGYCLMLFDVDVKFKIHFCVVPRIHRPREMQCIKPVLKSSIFKEAMVLSAERFIPILLYS